MLVLHYPFFRLGEAWFDEGSGRERVDLILYRQHPQPPPHACCHPRFTLVSDLRREPGDILAAMSKETQYKIRRAGQRDGLQHRFRWADTAGAIPEFCQFYDRFSQQKRLARANVRRLSALAQVGGLALSVVSEARLGALVWHAYLVAPGRARLLYSASHYRDMADSGVRNLTGRANRYLHWCDMLELRERGISSYDWGGWYAGTSDEERLRVNRFKEEFAGALVKEYDGWAACTLKGRMVVVAARLAGRQL